MDWSEITTVPSVKTLRRFAGLWILFFTGLAFWHGIHEDRRLLASILLGISFTIGPLGCVWPKFLGPIYVGWMMLVFPIGWLLARLFLAIVFFGLLTPVGLFFWLRGRDALGLRPKPGKSSYWSMKPNVDDERAYFQQF